MRIGQEADRAAVLVVDDDPVTRKLLERVLCDNTFDPVFAEDGEVAEALLRDRRFDAVLLDLILPGISGEAVLAGIRSHPRTVNLPVVLVSTIDDAARHVELFELGADDFVQKPFVAQELVARVRVAIRRTKLLTDLNPLTSLPGNGAILREISRRLALGEHFAGLYVDLDNFKGFNDHYGFIRGDRVIERLADAIADSLAAAPEAGGFVGHVGGDDFVVLVVPEAAKTVAAQVLSRFDSIVPELCDPEDVARGWIDTVDRARKAVRIPLVSASIGVVSNVSRSFSSVAEFSHAAAEMKHVAKSRLQGSAIAFDQRT